MSTDTYQNFATDWQRPARTEEWAHEQWQASGVASKFVEHIDFPWATLIDLRRRGKTDRASKLRDKLLGFGPKKTLIRATVCQHIWASDIIEELLELKVTDLFWSHAKIEQRCLEGIRVHPFPLYPVAFEERMTTRFPSLYNHPGERSLLYSFAGAYDPGVYLSPVRDWIFNLPNRTDAVLRRRGEWHFEQSVYGEQIDRHHLDATVSLKLSEQRSEYRRLLESSTFSLCPSGAGPNTIRLWETLAAGAIPVLISDQLELPGPSGLWDRAIVRVQEDEAAITSLPRILEELAKTPEKIDAMRAYGEELWSTLIFEGPKNLLGALSSSVFLETHV